MGTEVDKHDRTPTKQNFTGLVAQPVWIPTQIIRQYRRTCHRQRCSPLLPSLHLCTWCACHPRILARAAEELPGRRKGRSALLLANLCPAVTCSSYCCNRKAKQAPDVDVKRRARGGERAWERLDAPPRGPSLSTALGSVVVGNVLLRHFGPH